MIDEKFATAAQQVLDKDWIPQIVRDLFKVKSNKENCVSWLVGSYYAGYADFYEKFLEEVG